jgi:DNA polymerase elongation subunit (family B)
MEQMVLILDIETSPLLVYIWELKDQYVGLNQMIQDWHIMAWSAKWLNDPAKDIIYYDKRHDKNDKRILEKLWVLLNMADVVITQNGKAFDAKKINARFMLHGMQPPKPYKHLDTYLIAKNAAAFTSHSLEYLTERFCTKYKKLSHPKFPGLSLWKECLKGNMKAWDEMKIYNIHDVLSTEEFYNKIKAWAPQNAPKLYNLEYLNRQCRICGVKGQIEFRGYEGIKRQVHCKSCGKWDKWPKEKNK